MIEYDIINKELFNESFITFTLFIIFQTKYPLIIFYTFIIIIFVFLFIFFLSFYLLILISALGIGINLCESKSLDEAPTQSLIQIC